ncbi:hypothetical protein IEQ34_018385 [Dendrobium chrysotoxum]|uniref:Uncharacterized protein n=1 Tax=Dendrobium chrysotoxum TaxID=161865 RepID=A0AAV7GC79_DENCH|nr:hypothetical protein IEQ34_018385 [Dendrobium chrysotoxum]
MITVEVEDERAVGEDGRCAHKSVHGAGFFIMVVARAFLSGDVDEHWNPNVDGGELDERMVAWVAVDRGVVWGFDHDLKNASVVFVGVVRGRGFPGTGPVGTVGHPCGYWNVGFCYGGIFSIFFREVYGFLLFFGVQCFGALSDGFREAVDTDLEFVVFALDPTPILDEIWLLFVFGWIDF